MSRRYPTADLYGEQEQDFYARPRRDRNYDEIDLDIPRERERDRRPARTAVAETVVSDRRQARQPEFLRDDYARTAAGPLVVREEPREREREYERERLRTDVSQVGSRRGGGGPPADRVPKDDYPVRDRDGFSDAGRSRFRGGPERSGRGEREEIVVREKDRGPGPQEPRERDYREVDREEVYIRRSDRETEAPRRRERDYEETDINTRRSQAEPLRRGEDVVREREDITFRIGEGEWRPPRRDHSPPRTNHSPPRTHHSPPRGGPSPPRSEANFRPRRDRGIEREELQVREEARTPPQREYREIDREEITIREREHEHERTVPASRHRSLGPPIAREREEFVFRRREPRAPSPPPPPQDYEREEIIIRRRERTPPREPTPEPEPEPEPEREIVRDPSPDRLPPIFRPPIVQEIITHHRHIDHGVERARSPTPPPPARSPSPPPPPAPAPVQQRDESLEIEIRRRGMRNGHKFYEEDIIYDRDREVDGPRREEDLQIVRRRSQSARASRNGDERRDSGRQLRRDMWTEITKDLVIREAIDEMNYGYEETENHFYVIEYLQYEDVLRLVELSEDIRRERRERIKELQWEREERERLQAASVGRGKVEERVYERDYIYDRRNGRHR